MNVKNRYLINDYLKDRNSLQDPRRITQQRTGTMLRSPAEMKMMGVGVNTTTQPTQPAQTSSAAVVPPIKQAPVQQPTQPTVAPESAPATGLTENDVNSMLTTDHVQTQMNTVLTELLDFANRKFEYNAKESPLYTILQQQAAKEARIASGRAYSRAVANAGGFGSSYATLAAEEASRQVMAGLDDQQLALYQAAKEEWDSQWTSKLQQYQALQGIYGIVEEQENKQKAEANAAALGMNKDTYDLLVYAGQSGWYNGRNETELRTMLANYAAGNPNIDVNAIVDQLKGGSGTVVQPGEPVLSEEVRNAAMALQTAYGGEYYSPKAMSAYLKSMGYTDQEITQALEVQRGLAAGTVLDYKAGNAQEALAYGETLNDALRNGTLTQSEYDAAKKQNSGVIRNELIGEKQLSEEQVATAKEAVKQGVLTIGDYQEIVVKHTNNEIDDLAKENENKKILKESITVADAKKVLDVINGVLLNVDEGVMTEAEANEIIKKLAENEYAYKIASKLHNSLPRLKNDKDGAWRLNDAQDEAYKYLEKAYEDMGKEFVGENKKEDAKKYMGLPVK